MSNDGKSVFVQCNNEETFYRFPGGGVEFGETAAEAIKRELIEEFNLQSEIGSLVCLNKSIIERESCDEDSYNSPKARFVRNNQKERHPIRLSLI